MIGCRRNGAQQEARGKCEMVCKRIWGEAILSMLNKSDSLPGCDCRGSAGIKNDLETSHLS